MDNLNLLLNRLQWEASHLWCVGAVNVKVSLEEIERIKENIRSEFKVANKEKK